MLCYLRVKVNVIPLPMEYESWNLFSNESIVWQGIIYRFVHPNSGDGIHTADTSASVPSPDVISGCQDSTFFIFNLTIQIHWFEAGKVVIRLQA